MKESRSVPLLTAKSVVSVDQNRPDPVKIWDTKSVAVKDRFSFFREGVCQAFLNLSVDSPKSSDFSGRVERRDLPNGAIGKLTAVADPPSHRTSADVAKISDHYFALQLQLTGQMVTKVSGEENARKPGNIILYPSDRLFSLYPKEGQNLSLLTLFVAPSSLPSQVIAQVQKKNVEISNGLLAPPPLSECLYMIDRRYLTASFEELNALYAASISLVAASLLQERDFMEGACADRVQVRDGIVSSMKTFIEDHLRDPLLSPALIANRFGMSTRYVHKLFSTSNETFGSYMLSRRLEHAKMDLCDPAFLRLSVAEIAYRWGFKDLSSFHRNFKDRFDLTPGQARSIKRFTFPI